MDHPRTDAERSMEHDADELEDRIHRLEEDIDEAEKKAEPRRQDADVPLENAAGDWEDESEGAQRGG